MQPLTRITTMVRKSACISSLITEVSDVPRALSGVFLFSEVLFIPPEPSEVGYRR